MFEEWIKEHLPKDIPSDIINNCVNLCGYDIRGLTIYCEDDRGPEKAVFTARNQEELRIWAFKQVAADIAQRMELRSRPNDNLRWRYVRDHAENGRWLYIEHSRYQYNTIDDSRLAWFETYLRLVKAVMPAAQWNTEVQERIRLMNISFKVPHWDYDKAKMQFVEISDSKYVSQGIEEPAPGTIIRKE